MKFYDYIKKENEIETFRNLNVKVLNRTNNQYNELVEKIENSFKLKEELIKTLETLNKNISVKSCKLQFGFCCENEESIDIEELKIKKTRIKKLLKEKLFDINDKLAKSQIEVERKIKFTSE